MVGFAEWHQGLGIYSQGGLGADDASSQSKATQPAICEPSQRAGLAVVNLTSFWSPWSATLHATEPASRQAGVPCNLPEQGSSEVRLNCCVELEEALFFKC